MAVRKVSGGFRVVKKNGSLGKRLFSTEAKAKKAQAKGKSLAGRFGFKGGGGKKATPKKATKSNPNPPASPAPAKKNGKMTQGRIMRLDALAGPGANRLLKVLQGADPENELKIGLQLYTGINFRTGELSLETASALWNGYAGSVNEGIYGGVSKVLGNRPYPNMKVKNANDIMDNLTMHGIPAFRVFENRGDLQEAYRQWYLSQHGFDLGKTGSPGYQPLKMIESKGAYTAWKFFNKKVIKGLLKINLAEFKIAG